MKFVKSLVFVFLFFACSNNYGYFRTFQEAKNIFLSSYLKYDLFDHFPNEFKQSSIIGGRFTPSDNSNCFGVMFLTLKQDSLIISDLKRSKYIATGYLNKFPFQVITDDLVIENSSELNPLNSLIHFKTDSMIPIIDFSINDFLLGEVPDSFYLKDEKKYMPITKHVVPSDLFVCVIDAKYGDYWKNGCKCYRNEILEQWKNGYSKGIAISEKHHLVTYWAVTW